MNKKASAAGREEVFLDISIQGDSPHYPLFLFVSRLASFSNSTERKGA
jgi:hypothetical protein